MQLKVLLLLVLFLGAQLAALAHETDLHAHSGGDNCEVCLSATGLGHAALPGGSGPVLPPTDAGSLDLPYTPRSVPSSTVPVPPCRGPPMLFLS